MVRAAPVRAAPVKAATKDDPQVSAQTPTHAPDAARGVIDEITIRDLGVIAEAVLPLGPGFTAVTGETGAGKTMVVQALGLLMGERAVAGQVRVGSAQSWVEGRWRVPLQSAVAE